ncbi:MAG TPA: flagellar hook-length control protein FliK [Burkholderiales bacterium]|nr:flagellar hook-length control protein FliK [Burkholderiales bacterium]
MDLPIPTLPQPTGVPQPAASPAPGAQPSAADAAGDAFSQILAAGLGVVAPSAPDPALEAGEAASAAPRHKGESPESDPPDPVALFLTVIGLPVSPPLAPAATATANTDAEIGAIPSSAMEPAKKTLRAPAGAADAAQAPGRGIQAEVLVRAAEPAAHAQPLIPVPADPVHGAGETPATDAANAAPVLPLAAHAAQQPHLPAAAAEIRTPLRAQEWNADLGKTLVWMANSEHSTAEIRLNPPELGPLEIKLTLGAGDGGQANVAFASPHGAVREAIEAAMPQLRDMLAGSGITLGQTTVSAESFRQPGDPGGSRSERDASADSGERVEGATAASPARAGVGLVDTFA